MSAEEELEGLDIGEHGELAYPDFAGASSQTNISFSMPAKAKETEKAYARV